MKKVKLFKRVLLASRSQRIKRISRLGIAVTSILTFMIFAISYYGETVGNFTLSIDRDAYQAGITLLESVDTEEYKAMLFADRVTNADGMTSLCGTEYSDFAVGDDVCIPPDEDLESKDGSNNGNSYLAYTFYLKNAGQSVVDVLTTIDVISSSKQAEEALRVKIIINGISATYAKRQRENGINPGQPEPLTISFNSNYNVMNQSLSAMEIGKRVKITIVLWYEGEDADHNLNLIGGGVKLEMIFKVTKVYE